jgi:phenylpyruvate tautomerase PptA (4-oxalocrotonate tautomerase family)
MPYLQLDVPERYPADVKRELARSLGELCARVMQTAADRVVVGFRELPDGSLWRCGEAGPVPAGGSSTPASRPWASGATG